MEAFSFFATCLDRQVFTKTSSPLFQKSPAIGGSNNTSHSPASSRFVISPEELGKISGAIATVLDAGIQLVE